MWDGNRDITMSCPAWVQNPVTNFDRKAYTRNHWAPIQQISVTQFQKSFWASFSNSRYSWQVDRLDSWLRGVPKAIFDYVFWTAHKYRDSPLVFRQKSRIMELVIYLHTIDIVKCLEVENRNSRVSLSISHHTRYWILQITGSIFVVSRETTHFDLQHIREGRKTHIHNNETWHSSRSHTYCSRYTSDKKYKTSCEYTWLYVYTETA